MIFSYPLTWRAPIGRAGFSGLRGALFIGRATFSREAKRGARRILEACMCAWMTAIGPVQRATVLRTHKPLTSRTFIFHFMEEFGGCAKCLGPLLIQISFAYRKFVSQHSIANEPRVASSSALEFVSESQEFRFYFCQRQRRHEQSRGEARRESRRGQMA